MERIYVKPGERYGKLIILKEVKGHRQPNGRMRRRFFCRCGCGGQSVVQLASLRSGNTTSCGCVQAAARHANATHGYSGTSTYWTWKAMIQRCCNRRHKNFRLYGGRGITVCKRWRESFEAFLSDMGERPSPEHSIDRADNESGYRKDNCRWATRTEQARNTSRNIMLTHDGQTLCLSEWASRIGMSWWTLYYRFRSGWSTERMLTQPIRRWKNDR